MVECLNFFLFVVLFFCSLGSPDDAICRDGFAWVGMLSKPQAISDWHWFGKNRSRELNVTCVALKNLDENCKAKDLEILMWNQYWPIPWEVTLGEPATYKSPLPGEWWVQVSCANECPASVIFSVGLSTPSWHACPVTKSGQCSGHGFCDVTSPLTSPGVCRCDHDDTVGYWNGSECEDCGLRYFGQECKREVTCVLHHGFCAPGKCWGQPGHGKCTSCRPSYFGENCEHVVGCQGEFGTCREGSCYGLNGTGRCDACDATHYNANCSQPVSCDAAHGICMGPEKSGTSCSGPNGTGQCTECQPFYHGPRCSDAVLCNTDNGACLSGDGKCYGPYGTGLCTSCKRAFFGQYCDKEVPCDRTHGECDNVSCSGINGTGACSRCISKGWTGTHCDQHVSHPPIVECILAACIILGGLAFISPFLGYGYQRWVLAKKPNVRAHGYDSLRYYSGNALAAGVTPFAQIKDANPSVPTKLYF